MRIVDASEFLEFKYEYDQQTICGRAVIHGRSIGIIGNNGPIMARKRSIPAMGFYLSALILLRRLKMPTLFLLAQMQPQLRQ